MTERTADTMGGSTYGGRVGVPAAVPAHVHHVRHRPFRYELRHRTSMWLVDADEPDAAFPRWLRPFASIRGRDHLGHDDEPLGGKVRRFVDAQGLGWTAHRVLVLTGARSLGYVFNPLSTYFCFDRTGRLEGVLAEVHNTYGERHCYPLAVVDGTASVDKEFYVSPFFAVEGRYDIRVRLTPDDVAVAISLAAPDGPVLFTGAVHGDLVPATARSTVEHVARDPLPSLRVSALIRWHGIRLWARRLPVVPRRPHHSPRGMA